MFRLISFLCSYLTASSYLIFWKFFLASFYFLGVLDCFVEVQGDPFYFQQLQLFYLPEYVPVLDLAILSLQKQLAMPSLPKLEMLASLSPRYSVSLGANVPDYFLNLFYYYYFLSFSILSLFCSYHSWFLVATSMLLEERGIRYFFQVSGLRQVTFQLGSVLRARGWLSFSMRSREYCFLISLLEGLQGCFLLALRTGMVSLSNEGCMLMASWLDFLRILGLNVHYNEDSLVLAFVDRFFASFGIYLIASKNQLSSASYSSHFFWQFRRPSTILLTLVLFPPGASLDSNMASGANNESSFSNRQGQASCWCPSSQLLSSKQLNWPRISRSLPMISAQLRVMAYYKQRLLINQTISSSHSFQIVANL